MSPTTIPRPLAPRKWRCTIAVCVLVACGVLLLVALLRHAPFWFVAPTFGLAVAAFASLVGMPILGHMVDYAERLIRAWQGHG